MAWYVVTIPGNPYIGSGSGAWNGDVMGDKSAKEAAKAFAKDMNRDFRAVLGRGYPKAKVVKTESVRSAFSTPRRIRKARRGSGPKNLTRWKESRTGSGDS